MDKTHAAPVPHTRFISFEGGEGCGKTSVIQAVISQMSQHNVISTFEPGGTNIGMQIRSWLLQSSAAEDIGIEAEFLLFSAARAEHVRRKIIPALHAGMIVLCDRYIDSSRVYQGYVGGLDAKWMETVIAMSTQRLSPSLTFLLDGDPYILRKRVQKRATVCDNPITQMITRFDRQEKSYHDKIRDGYLKIAQNNPQRLVTINAEQDLASVVENVLQKLQMHLNMYSEK